VDAGYCIFSRRAEDVRFRGLTFEWDDDAEEDHRADILEFNPDGSGEQFTRRVFGMRLESRSILPQGTVGVSKQRDDLGDDRARLHQL
jgi:hypothetical protein